MPLTTQTPSGFVTSLQNAVSGFTTKLRNFASGSAAGALLNAVATQLLFLQSQAQYVYSVTRAATSQGADLTSFVTDYGLNPPRVPATQATTTLVFGRYQFVTSAQLIPLGTVVQTPTTPPATPVQFAVIADNGNPNYNPALNGGLGGYAIPSGGSSVAVTAQCTVAGTVGNVTPLQLSVIVTPGIPADYVNNPLPVQNGFAQESDAALLIRFAFYISSLATANVNAIAAAILSVQANLSYTINDRLNAAGVATPAFFTAVVDDGTAAISATTLSAISAAINLKRAAGISFVAIAPQDVTINVVVSGTVIAPSFNAGTVRTAIQSAIVTYITTNGVGGANLANGYVPSLSVSYFGISQIVASFIGLLSTQGLLSYTSIMVNGAATNAPLTTYQLAIAGPTTVTVQ